jgi:hypothetical protein
MTTTSAILDYAPEERVSSQWIWGIMITWALLSAAIIAPLQLVLFLAHDTIFSWDVNWRDAWKAPQSIDEIFPLVLGCIAFLAALSAIFERFGRYRLTRTLIAL